MRIESDEDETMSKMTPTQMKKRTKDLGIAVLRLASKLPLTAEGRAVRNQLVRSGTSIGANYRAACRARTTKEFVAKLGHVEEEADETMYWLEIAAEVPLLDRPTMVPIWRESNEILAIVVSSIRTARESLSKPAVRASKSAIRNPQSAISGGRK